jgi:hypothetical protein
VFKAGGRAYSSTMWPPPAPLERRDHSELPANLRPSVLSRRGYGDYDDINRDRREGDERRTDDSRHEHYGNSKLEALPEGSEKLNSGNSNQAVSTHPSRQDADSKFDADRQGPENGSENMELAVVATESANKPERSDAPCASGVDAGGLHSKSAVSDTQTSLGQTSSNSDDDNKSIVVGYSTLQDSMLSTANLRSEICRPPSSYEEPMVIEFMEAVPSAEGTAVRAGRKRARVGSESNLQDVVKHSFVKHPVTFYGKRYLHLIWWH